MQLYSQHRLTVWPDTVPSPTLLQQRVWQRSNGAHM